jgi:hypothetical protein
MTVDVQLLGYKFQFRQLTWKEELRLAVAPGKNSVIRAVLSHALEDVSGLPVKDPKEAAKIFATMSSPVVRRVFFVYKGSLPPNRRFETAGLYCAPEPSVYVKRIIEDEDIAEQEADRVVQNLENQFGKKELAEAAEVDRQIVKASKLRGAVKVTPEPPIQPVQKRNVRGRRPNGR